MNNVANPLLQQMIGRKLCASNIINGRCRNSIQIVFASQHQNRRNPLANLNGKINARVLSSKNHNPINIEWRHFVAQFAIWQICV